MQHFMWSALLCLVIASGLADEVDVHRSLLPFPMKRSCASPKRRPRKIVVKKTRLKTDAAAIASPLKKGGQQQRVFLRTEEEQISGAIKLKLHMFSRNQVLNNVDDEGFTIPQRVTEKFRETKLSKTHIQISGGMNLCQSTNLVALLPTAFLNLCSPRLSGVSWTMLFVWLTSRNPPSGQLASTSLY